MHVRLEVISVSHHRLESDLDVFLTPYPQNDIAVETKFSFQFSVHSYNSTYFRAAFSQELSWAIPFRWILCHTGGSA